MPLNKEELTAERLRKFPGFENVTDEEADHIVESIKALAITIYDHHTKSKTDEN